MYLVTLEIKSTIFLSGRKKNLYLRMEKVTKVNKIMEGFSLGILFTTYDEHTLK